MKCVIMAGGKGTRLWPVSRQNKPKQFQCLISNKTMLQETYLRMRKIFAPEDIYIATNKEYVGEVENEILEFPKENIIGEPIGRGTAPSIALSSAIIAAKDPEEIMGIFAADHFVKDPEPLFKAVQKAGEFLKKNGDYLITFGVNPTSAETGYGYIEKGDLLEKRDEIEFIKVKRFVEKPDFTTAQDYVDSGNFFWNSGMFMWKTSTIIDKFKLYIPDIYNRLIKIKEVVGTENFSEVLEKEFPEMDKISIDYAVMENEPNTIVIPLNISWSDIGSWTSLKDALIADHKDHFVRGEHIDFGSRNLLVYGSNKLITTIGIKDLIIIDTEDAILICDQDKSQLVSDIVKRLEEKGKIRSL